MGAIDAKLASVGTELENQRRVLDRLEEQKQHDHDKQVKHGEWIDAIFRRVEVIEKARDEEKKEAHKDHKDEHREKSSRGWQFWLAILGPFLGAILGALATKLVK